MTAAPQFPDIPDPSAMLELGMGYWGSKAFLLACELKLFTYIDEGSRTDVEISTSLELPLRTTRILLDALTAQGLLGKMSNKYRLAAPSRQFLVMQSPFYLGDFFSALDRLFYAPSSSLYDAIETNKPVWNTDHDGHHVPIGKADGEILTRAMNCLSKPIGLGLARACNLGRSRHLLDIGGGSGIMSMSAVKANPRLDATVLDRPDVCGLADQYIAEEGLRHRIHTQALDFLENELPDGFDVHLFSNILHNYGTEIGYELLEKSFRSLAPGGLILVVEFDIRPDGISPLFASLFNLFALAVMEHGEVRPAEEYNRWMKSIGFVNIEHVPLFRPSTLVQGIKPL